MSHSRILKLYGFILTGNVDGYQFDHLRLQYWGQLQNKKD
jgi:hypothetical protein